MYDTSASKKWSSSGSDSSMRRDRMRDTSLQSPLGSVVQYTASLENRQSPYMHVSHKKWRITCNDSLLNLVHIPSYQLFIVTFTTRSFLPHLSVNRLTLKRYEQISMKFHRTTGGIAQGWLDTFWVHFGDWEDHIHLHHSLVAKECAIPSVLFIYLYFQLYTWSTGRLTRPTGLSVLYDCL